MTAIDFDGSSVRNLADELRADAHCPSTLAFEYSLIAVGALLVVIAIMLAVAGH